MKILIITDTHFLIRNGNQSVANYQKKFFDDYLFPYIENNKNSIDLILHLGDLFDQRKQIDFRGLDFCRKNFLEKINSYNLPIHLILGNHCVYYKETNSINSPALLLEKYKNFTIFENPQEVNGLLYLPWINKENIEESKNIILNSSAKFCFGHLSISGFLMMSGTKCEHSDFSSSDFLKFKRVFSGHFHWRSSQKNIHYLGSPYQLNWSDVGNDRGFHIFDTETDTLELFKNPLEQYVKLEYDDSCFDSLEGIDFSEFTEKFVKLIVKNKTKPILYTKFIQSLYEIGVVQLQITDQELQKSLQEQNVSIKTIPEIIGHNIEIQDFAPELKSRLLEYMTGLYKETLC